MFHAGGLLKRNKDKSKTRKGAPKKVRQAVNHMLGAKNTETENLEKNVLEKAPLLNIQARQEGHDHIPPSHMSLSHDAKSHDARPHPASLAESITQLENHAEDDVSKMNTTNVNTNLNTVSFKGVAQMKPGRAVEIPNTGYRNIPAMNRDEGRTLTVGRDISLNGEINSCDHLVVEGTVRAELKGGESLDIMEGGLFEGRVEINNADIAGRFEGELVVNNRLVVRSTGVINGTIRYGELEVEAGAMIEGSMAPMVKSDAQQPFMQEEFTQAMVENQQPANEDMVAEYGQGAVQQDTNHSMPADPVADMTEEEQPLFAGAAE